jgi:hypothetical protein
VLVYRSLVEPIDVFRCFYDDVDYRRDADRDSQVLKAWHRALWSKELPSGERAEWVNEAGGYLTFQAPTGAIRVSSDTIATTHSSYPSIRGPGVVAQLGREALLRYERAFYTIGGFIIFPVHRSSLNQARGTDYRIADRFDLTLECIRRHYFDENENPLAAVLEVDANFFRLFGEGRSGFAAYDDFFHLQDLVRGDVIKWLDDSTVSRWNFEVPPLPASASAYRSYLDNVSAFVMARNFRIQAWRNAEDAG